MNTQSVCQKVKDVQLTRSSAKNFCVRSFDHTLQLTFFALHQNSVKRNTLTFWAAFQRHISFGAAKATRLCNLSPLFFREIKAELSPQKENLLGELYESSRMHIGRFYTFVTQSIVSRAHKLYKRVSIQKGEGFESCKGPYSIFTNALYLLKSARYHVEKNTLPRRVLPRGERCRAHSSSLLTACPTEPDQGSRTIVVTSGKGGVGKTTTTANLGMCIARLGYRVALVDADIGLRNLDLLLGLENRVLYTAMDIFEGECRLDQALIRDKRLKNLCLLAISKNRHRYNVTRQKMDQLVSSLSSLGYHYILIDCPAGIDVGFINAISPAQEAIVVTTPEITAMRDADRVAGILEANGIYNSKLLINRVRPDMIQRHDMMSVQDVQEVLGIPLLGAIPEDINVIISTNRGEPLVLRKKLTLSGIAFENAARRLMGKQDYLIDLQTPYKNIFQKIQAFVFRNETQGNTS